MMTPDDLLEVRIEALEARAMQQEQVIEDLNSTITAQWRIIDTLTRQFAILDDRIRDLARTGVALPDQPPPHY